MALLLGKMLCSVVNSTPLGSQLLTWKTFPRAVKSDIFKNLGLRLGAQQKLTAHMCVGWDTHPALRRCHMHSPPVSCATRPGNQPAHTEDPGRQFGWLQAPSPRAMSPRRAPWAGSVWTVALGPIWAQPVISGTYFVPNFFLSRFPLNRLGAPFGHLFDLGLCFLQEISAALAGLCNTSSQAAWAVGPVLPTPCWRLRGPVCPERKARPTSRLPSTGLWGSCPQRSQA